MGIGKEKGKYGMENGIGIFFFYVLRLNKRNGKITSFFQQT